MANVLHQKSMDRRQYFLIGLLLLIAGFLAGGIGPAQAQAGICMLYPSVPVPMEIAGLIQPTLDQAAELPGNVGCFAVTNVTQYSEYQWIISISGLDYDQEFTANWTAEGHVLWSGMIAVQGDALGEYQAALQGSDQFALMIREFPLPPQTIALWNGELPGGSDEMIGGELEAATGNIYFPFAGGTSAMFGPRGVHEGATQNTYAVDFLGWPQAGIMPDAVYAAQAGSVTWICRDSTQMSVRVGYFYYYHLVNDPGLREGSYFSLHQPIGRLVHGSFDDDCGWADQRWDAYHLHFVFGASGGEFGIENWKLDLSSSVWT